MKRTPFENPKTVNEAVTLCVKLVHSQARKWTRNHYSDYDDIAQEGFAGVVHAWNLFHGSEHEEKGYRFTSYAFLWIRANMKAYAEKNWKRLNGLKDGDISEMFDREEFGFEEDFRSIDLTRVVEKLSEEDQKIFALRKEGETFDTIAKEVGAKNLHTVRNRFLDICASFGE